MPPPDSIAVRRTEEEAGYVTFRPVVRQNFGLADLLGLVLSVTGKNPARIHKILRSGSVSFHSFHYSWDGFEIEEHELVPLLARFPDSDPSRSFRPENCTTALAERAGISHARPPRLLLELDRAAASRKRFLRRRSAWDALLAAAAAVPPAYAEYSYPRRADLYRLDLSAEQAAALVAAAQAFAPRDLRGALSALSRASYIIFVVPRETV